jgi:hypothetical protein
MKNLTITINEYNTTCGDGCCSDYGKVITVNGEELPCHNMDLETQLEQVLRHLGYDVELTTLYNGEEY